MPSHDAIRCDAMVNEMTRRRGGVLYCTVLFCAVQCVNVGAVPHAWQLASCSVRFTWSIGGRWCNGPKAANAILWRYVWPVTQCFKLKLSTSCYRGETLQPMEIRHVAFRGGARWKATRSQLPACDSSRNEENESN